MLVDADIENLVKKTAEFGNGKIHIIVNNAGFTWDGVIHKMTDKQWDTIIAMHCTGKLFLFLLPNPQSQYDTRDVMYHRLIVHSTPQRPSSSSGPAPPTSGSATANPASSSA